MVFFFVPLSFARLEFGFLLAGVVFLVDLEAGAFRLLLYPDKPLVFFLGLNIW